MKIYGSTVIGEKGQIVVPVEARKSLGLENGDHFFVFGHGKILHLIKSSELDKHLEKMTKKWNDIKELKDQILSKKGEDV